MEPTYTLVFNNFTNLRAYLNPCGDFCCLTSVADEVMTGIDGLRKTEIE